MLRGPSLVFFTDIIEIGTIFIKTIFKDSRKIKRIRKLNNKMQSVYFLI